MKNKTKSIIGQNIRQIRRKQGISQDRLSKLADIAFHTINKIEAGSTKNPSINTIQRIAESLKVSVDRLLRKK